MKVVLLAGGQGTRMREETEFRPKPMVEVGGRPVLWHIMRTFAAHKVNQFVICTGYKSEQIKDYFLSYQARNSDFTLVLGDPPSIQYHGTHPEAGWQVTLADTGPATMTGGRVKAVETYVSGETFLCTYGDGIADIDVSELLAFHRSHGKVATITAVQPTSRFGILELDQQGGVVSFREKPQVDGWINVGYFVFEAGVFDYLGENSVLEEEPLMQLAGDGELVAFKHRGFWQPMDTYREAQELNALWHEGVAPWTSAWDQDT